MDGSGQLSPSSDTTLSDLATCQCVAEDSCWVVQQPGAPRPRPQHGAENTEGEGEPPRRGEGGGQLENVIGYSITANYTNIFLKDSLQ